MTTTAVTRSSEVVGSRSSGLWGLIQKIGFWIIVLIIIIYTLFPFYWMIVTSLKTEDQIFARADLVPASITFDNYRAVLAPDANGENQFLLALFNSSVVASTSTLLALAIGSFAAYALGRLHFRGRTLMLYAVLAMTMFPQISILSGLFAITQELGVYGSLSALLVTYPIITLPFTVWTLTSFFKGLPGELEQAAYVDGATTFQTFYRILLPLTAPALITTGLLAFISAWNEYLFALTFTVVNPDQRTVPVAIALFSGTTIRQDPLNQIMAAAVVVTLPLIVLVLIFQRRIVEGLTAGAVKG
jgi:trehalose/maltose transport system permease protein